MTARPHTTTRQETTVTAIAYTVMPDADEFLRRLKTVDDTPHMVQKLYPHLLTKAGQEQTGIGFVLALHLAVADYTSGMPAITFKVLQMRMGQFVKALIDDELVLDDALAALRDLGLLV